MHARGIEHHSHGVQNVLGAINIVLASGPHRTRELRLRDDHRPGQRAGRTRARPEVRSTARAARHLQPGTSRLCRAECGASIRATCPARASTLTKSSARSIPGEIRGLLSICFNPVVSLPDNNFVRRMLEKLEFYVAIDFFLNDSGALRGHRPARFPAGRGRGHRHHCRRPRDQDQPRHRLSRRRPSRTGGSFRISRRR